MTATVKSLSAAALARNIDKLGALNAQIAALSKQAEAIKDDIKVLGAGEYYGKTFKAVVTATTASRLDTAKVKATLTAAQLAKCMVESKRTAVSLYDL